MDAAEQVAPLCRWAPSHPARPEQNTDRGRTTPCFLTCFSNWALTFCPQWPETFRLGLNLTTSSPGLPASRQQMVGLLNPYNQGSQFPKINLYLSWFSFSVAATAAKLLQSRPTLCSSIDGSPPSSPVPGILQAGTLECCHFLLQCMKVKSESEVAQSCLTLHHPMDCSLTGSSVHGFSRQEYWSGVPLPSPLFL